MVVIATLASWWALNRTAFGKHLRAAGENPKALDTVGISVSKVRHAGVLLSGVLSGVGGSALALSIGQFIGSGDTMVQGRVHRHRRVPVRQLQPARDARRGRAVRRARRDPDPAPAARLHAIPDTLVQTIPYVVVILVLALVGRTRLPEAAGEHYETED